MLAYLCFNYLHSDLARFAKAKNPPRAVPLPAWGSKKLNIFWKDMEELSEWISAIEVDRKGRRSSCASISVSAPSFWFQPG